MSLHEMQGNFKMYTDTPEMLLKFLISKYSFFSKKTISLYKDI